jgi:hypothetical protein
MNITQATTVTDIERELHRMAEEAFWEVLECALPYGSTDEEVIRAGYPVWVQSTNDIIKEINRMVKQLKLLKSQALAVEAAMLAMHDLACEIDPIGKPISRLQVELLKTLLLDTREILLARVAAIIADESR